MELVASQTLKYRTPVRLISRLTTEYGLMNLRQSLHLVPGRLETSVVAQALIRNAVPKLIGPDGLALPESRPLISSIGSIARSLNCPTETARRHVHALADHGFFVVEAQGVVFAPSPEAWERILNYLRCMHDNMLWLVAELQSWDLVGQRTQATEREPPLKRVLMTAIDLRLLSFELFREPLGGWTSMFLWVALSACSVRHITTSRRLSMTYTWRSTPDEMRRPVSILALSAASGLPYATVWRHLARLEASGWVARTPEGYIMLTKQLLSKAIESRVTRYVRCTLDWVDNLVGSGLDPGKIPLLYFGTTPTLVPIRLSGGVQPGL